MVHRFGAFELDEERFELRKAGTIIPLQRRAFDLLLYLVRNPDKVLSKERLLEHVWPDVTVTKDALPHAMMAVRAALGDDVDNPVFIHTVRGRGYRFVTSVIQMAARPASSPELDSRPLIGRVEVLAALRARIARATDGAGGLVLVTGETGIGKTRLIEELARDPMGTRVIAVRCASRPGAPDLWPIAEALRELETRGAVLSPPTRTLARATVDEGTLADAQRRFRLFDDIVGELTPAAESAPLLWLIDDLDHADDVSLELLQFLIPRLRTVRALVVATHRPANARATRFGAAFGALSSVPSTLVTRLEPFTRAEVAQYLAHVLPQPPSEAILDRVYGKTVGNPLLVSQLVHVLRADERLRSTDMGTSTLVGDENMREAIAHRLAGLPAPVVNVLAMASVFGQVVPLAPLASALAATNADVLRDLDVATAGKIVAPSGSGTYRFTYPLVRDVLYKRLPVAERARLHTLAADALEQHAGEVTDHAIAGDIARHLVEAAIAGDVDRAVDWSLRASELARESGDETASAAYATRGLDALLYARRADPEKRARLLRAARRPP